MTATRLLAIGCAMLALSRARSTACDPSSSECSAAATSVGSIGSDIVLAPGQTVAIESTNVSLSFERVVSDSRCPRDVQCVWAGNALARLRARVEGDTGRTVELNSTVEPRSSLFDGYVVRFVALAPEPVSTTAIDQANYRLTVRLERP